MTKYADLEKEHGLEDIMPVDEYRHRASQMKGAWEQLVKHRRQIRGRDLAPSYDAVRFWPFIVSAYSLLEQCLKLLVGIRTEGYLDGSERKRRRITFFRSSIIGRCLRLGGSRDITARRDRHNLAKVFGRLTKLDRDMLEECYAEYASFVQFDAQFPTLDEYLKALCKSRGQIAWRYFLLEKNRENIGKLPGPLNPDMLLEVMRCAVDILMAKGWADHGMHGIHRRLMHQLGEASSSALLQEARSIEDSNAVMSDLDAWAGREGGLVNAFSKHIRVGALDRKCGDALVKCLDTAVDQLRESAEQEYDVDMLRFLHITTRCCMTTDGSRFKFCNHRPTPISESDQWHGGWSLSWRVEESSWSGPIDDPPSRRLHKWGLPLRTGQIFNASWHKTANAPAKQELVSGTCGELRVLHHERVLVRMWARVDSYIMFSIRNATFIRIGDCPDADEAGNAHEGGQLELVTGYACPECAGTGFCRDCLGEATKTADCRACADEKGLCPACRGYGLDGHHAILDAAAT